MKTRIYASYSDFLQREDKAENGVNKDFAAKHPNWEKENERNEGCWNCSDCSGCSDCSDCSRCNRCSRCSDCSGCSDCNRCSRCSDCSDCSDCNRCSDCSDCSGCSDCSDCNLEENKKESDGTVQYAGFVIPVIQNIHQAVLYAVDKPEALRMNDWHTCDTTHCRAGWVVHLAGPAGYALEKKTSTEFAAKQIYKASSLIKVSPTRFFEDSKKAMADIVRCAEEELKTNTTL